MAQQRKQQDLLSRLADRGEQVVGRITDLPGAKQLVDRISTLAKTVDDVQKKLRGLDRLEKRVAQLEKRIDKLEGKSTTRRTTAKRSTSGTRKTTRRSSSS